MILTIKLSFTKESLTKLFLIVTGQWERSQYKLKSTNSSTEAATDFHACSIDCKIACIIYYSYHLLFDFYLSLFLNFCFLVVSVLLLIILFLYLFLLSFYYLSMSDTYYFPFVPKIDYHSFFFRYSNVRVFDIFVCSLA